LWLRIIAIDLHFLARSKKFPAFLPVVLIDTAIMELLMPKPKTSRIGDAGFLAVIPSFDFTLGGFQASAGSRAPQKSGSKKLVGSDESDVLRGGSGNDRISGGGGEDSIFGGNGHDKLSGDNGNDTIVGGSGHDRLSGGNGNDFMRGDAGSDKLDGGNGHDVMRGGSGKDYLIGGDGNDAMYGGSGGDFMMGGRGNDEMFGGRGNDLMFGGNGEDRMFGGAGHDKMTGGRGADHMVGGSGSDRLFGERGNDKMFGGAGSDRLTGGIGHDVLRGGSGNDRLYGGTGSDALRGGAGRDYLKGGAGRDKIFGDGGNDRLFGGDGNDRMYGGTGQDALRGGNHNDVLKGGAGNDDVFGGSGNDKAMYQMALNADAMDDYEGGKGIDTLSLSFTLAEWQTDAVQADIANYLQFLNVRTDTKSGQANNKAFEFASFGLDASGFEGLVVDVDGVTLDPVDDPVVGNDDQFTISEDSAATVFGSVLANDDVPDLVKSVALLSGPSDGVLVFNPGSLGAVDGSFSFDPNGAFEDLADGETRDVSFTYEVTDSNGDTDQATATITVTGENDSPIADAVSAALGEDDVSVLINVSGSDIDTTDTLSFEIVSAPMDAFGHQYGSVVNNGDGTFTFLTGDNFQFLNAGESREMTFTYVAVDNSGTATDTSAEQTVTVEVFGENDSPLVFAPPLDGDTFIFSTVDQSIFETGGASIQNPDLPFLGGSWKESFSELLVPGASAGFGGIDLPYPIPDVPGITLSSPSLTLTGSTSGRIGLQPFFSMTGGEIDASIPIGAYFDVPRQVEAGDTFRIGSRFLFGDDSSITTQSAEMEFGVDLVFDLAASLKLEYSSSSFGGGGSFDIIPSFDISEQINLFTTNSGDVGGDVPLSLFFRNMPGIDNFVKLEVAVPSVQTTGGFQDYGLGFDAGPLISSGSDEIASLTLDIDKVIAAALAKAVNTAGDAASTNPDTKTAAQVSLGVDAGFGFGFDAGPLGNFNLANFAIKADLLSSALSTKISLLQDFSLDLQDLPMMMILEDGSKITGLSLGDDIVVTAPVGFDADVDGDADGLVDFTIDVDMDAVLTTMVSLGFDTTFEMGAIRAIGTVTSDIFTNIGFNVFEGGAQGTEDDFLYYTKENLVSEAVEVFENTFDFVGFEPGSQDTTTELFDIA
jgi:VCBS repeat-containing protein